MSPKKHRVCPVAHAWSLDNRVRRWLHDPRKILAPYIEAGMTVLDLGCGPGFFTIDLARLVGEAGRVVATDLQDGMLAKLREKIAGSELEERITLHKCEANRIGAAGLFDFALAFYMVHEVPSQVDFFSELKTLLKPAGRILIVEPPIHVSNQAFAAMVATARSVGFTEVERPRIALSKAVVLKRG